MKKTANPIDCHVGAMVRLRRQRLAISQKKLAELLGVTFQQIQKYEKGTSRIGASRLQQISEALRTSPSYFFEGAITDGAIVPATVEGSLKEEDGIEQYLLTAEGILLNRAFVRIYDPKVRKIIVDLVASLAAKYNQ